MWVISCDWVSKVEGHFSQLIFWLPLAANSLATMHDGCDWPAFWSMEEIEVTGLKFFVLSSLSTSRRRSSPLIGIELATEAWAEVVGG